MNQGWISVHRQIKDWEWYSDSKIVHLFLHCLASANHKPKSWRGIKIDAGQFITSRDRLASELPLSVQQVRTALNKLKSTGEITIETTTKYSMISVTNWSKYQESNQPINKQATSEQPASNQQVTINNNNNNANNDNKNLLPENLKVSMPTDFELNDINKKYANDSNLTPTEKYDMVKDFIDYWVLEGSKKTDKGWQMAFRRNPIIKRKITSSKHRGQSNGTHQQTHKPSLAERATENRRQAERQIDEQSMGENDPLVRT